MKYLFVVIFLCLIVTSPLSAGNYTTTEDGKIVFHIESLDHNSRANLEVSYPGNESGSIHVDNVYVISLHESSTDEQGGKANSLFGKSEVIISASGTITIKGEGMSGGNSVIKTEFAEARAERTQTFLFDGKCLTVIDAKENISIEGYTAAYTSSDGRYVGAEVSGKTVIGSNDFSAKIVNQGWVTAKSRDQNGPNYITAIGNAGYNALPNTTGFAKTEAYTQMGTDKYGGISATGFVQSVVNTKPNN
ncbi:MAG: hypothetical protein US83_C0001G0043 [Candidatus Falkowbacteria bacterium GW2011_GWC2_38_22]|uniref:Uncharacterized protein n=1 Tax=Candidatus Falkowbacteria bacterium GW2011_GWE1_38_31 TaxID=1618638 RepID=A0A0G0MB30_9BACT|nr:MAG: hypothetical protein US73_C0004G0085 [Candidatus Falkowbacteria bacterium GW2011_GWF2_38_1205]KKQ62109.1 MAG: hypothetical protein US83_C0001G0043 [Candidatus Falkowbacteria bacterium GW2011_GWC2_38_22]KKQ64259.1 MAG: hypothetical protein US84_C0001G0043 [Candidatus Falkowbacteria bacterium GW2011_GWF1_38_22]KKQ66236.1 MAG: hypothetical protein US87_C0002G0043 [Candidatus Falkowbacteria bacterium GW2011_GWE2_38_254]KKQ70964.1 MAG: hypothetical protein US91_C0002G0043 [Candidatus Falkowb